MNYTEKFHLPQWEESDRVLREDFNQMCADIEQGLDRGQSTELDRFCRTAYNHYQCVKELCPFPRQLGVFHQQFGKNAGNIAGMSARDGFCHMGMGEAAPTAKDFFQSFEELSTLTFTAGGEHTPLKVNFTAPGPGRITAIPLTGSYSGVNGSTGECHVSLLNRQTMTLEASQYVSLPLRSTAGSGSYNIFVDLPFHGGRNYQLWMVPMVKDYSANMKLLTNGSLGLVEFDATPSATTVKELEVGTTSRGGLAVVQYSSFGDSQIQLTWDGEVVEPYLVLTRQENTKTVCEALYRRSGLVPETTTLRLDMTCGINGEVDLYHWGAVLL